MGQRWGREIRYRGLISIHPPRAGWDKTPVIATVNSQISIHPPRAGWDRIGLGDYPIFNISIHPPRAGWDIITFLPSFASPNFNPPTPCGVGLFQSVHSKILGKFQSTHPVRGGTNHRGQIKRSGLFQSTHPVRGGTRGEPNQRFYPDISIHPPRAGWDPGKVLLLRLLSHFNPPTPCGVGHQGPDGGRIRSAISIHPPRAGWDLRLVPVTWRTIDFNPPTPCGVGQQKFTKHDCKLLHMQQNTSDTEMILPKISYHAILSGSFHCKIPVRTGKGIFVHFPFARSTKSLGRPLAHRSLWPQNARFWSDKHSPDSKTEDYPFSHP